MIFPQIREVVIERDGEAQLKGLPVRAGDTVEFLLVRRRAAAGSTPRYPLHGTPLRYDNPFEPAADPGDWEANQ